MRLDNIRSSWHKLANYCSKKITMQQPPISSLKPAISTIAAVANQFILFGRDEAWVPIVDQLKIQKLMFYAQAWSLAMRETPLFEDDFEAWPWGPVIRPVYNQTSQYGRGPITGLIYEMSENLDNNRISLNFVHPAGVHDQETKRFLQETWDVHKHLTGIQLSNSTHAEGEPWTMVRHQYHDNLSQTPKIPKELMQYVFKGKLSQQ